MGSAQVSPGITNCPVAYNVYGHKRTKPTTESVALAQAKATEISYLQQESFKDNKYACTNNFLHLC